MRATRERRLRRLDWESGGASMRVMRRRRSGARGRYGWGGGRAVESEDAGERGDGAQDYGCIVWRKRNRMLEVETRGHRRIVDGCATESLRSLQSRCR